MHNTKYIPVVFAPADRQYVPAILQDWTTYVLDSETGYQELLRRLTGRHRAPRPASGEAAAPPTRPAGNAFSGRKRAALERRLAALTAEYEAAAAQQLRVRDDAENLRLQRQCEHLEHEIQNLEHELNRLSS
jgi:hypothetical protein